MYRVMIVDDEQVVCQGMQRLIDWGAYGFQVEQTASDGQEALELQLRERIQADKWETEEEKDQCMAALEEIPKDWKEGTISDLSGGGLRFHGKDQLERGAVVEVMLPLSLKSGIVPLTFFARVIACMNYEGSRIAFEVRGEFINIEDAEREIVVKYVFEEQRRRLRKEW